MIEPLESRQLFSTVPVISLTSKGTFSVVGTSSADKISFAFVNDDPKQGLLATVKTKNKTHKLLEPLASVKRIYIDAGGGNDSVFVGGSSNLTKPVTMLGGSGNDILNYSATGPILAVGGSGNDVVGADAILPITSSKNSEIIKSVFGQTNPTGINTIAGGAGNDTLSCDTNDIMEGDSGSDTAIVITAASDTAVNLARRNALAELYYARVHPSSIEAIEGFSLFSTTG
jgi:RTX calcium-binding nonapeptide repeat (4 copies)